jgi:mycofactocin system transcriptional regulator
LWPRRGLSGRHCHGCRGQQRTFFRYFESKNDIVWGDFTGELRVIRERFAQCPPDQPIMDAVRTVVVEFNRFDSAQVHWHRKRMELILKVPALQAYSTFRYREWRDVVADFVRERSGACSGDLLPRAVAHCALGAAVFGYEHWLAHPDAELTDVLEQTLHSLSLSFNLA